ncbi:MAG TPA: cbb3-type cytochrome c oxidase subunit I [Thermoplasmata archaeon]|nr:cbb3-type cytochrome c oxidase subunit I [Thermoplasmata archaeon]
MSAGELRASQSSGEGAAVPVFERPPALVQFLDATEDAIRLRLAKLRLFDRIFLLQRDWMTRITMLMVICSILWGAIGGFDAFGFQTQAVAYASGAAVHLSNVEIYSSVTLHGLRELFGFAQQLELALIGLLVVNALGIVPRHKWSLYSVVILLNGSMLLLQGPVYLIPFNDNYFPAVGWYFLSPLGVAGQSAYAVSPLWFFGWLALCAAVLIWTAWIVVHLLDWWRAHRALATGRRYPVFLWFVVGTLILLPLTYVPLVVSTVWDIGTAYFGWGINALANQVIFWMFGHAIVYVLFLIPIIELYVLIPILARRPIYSYRFAVASAIMFVLLTPLLGIHHLYLAPLPAWSTWLTMALSFAIVLPSAITFFSVWMTVKGIPRGQWEWNAVALFALLSFGGAIFGGLTGPALATIPWDVDVHNSLFVLGHFHAITVLSIVAGGYALVYAVFPILTGREWFSAVLARIHFVLTVVGGAILVLAFEELGNLGVLRREYILPILPAITLYQTILLGGIVITLVGQLFFVANGALTVFRGPLYSAAGLSFDEAVRRAAQSTAPRSGRVPIADRPFTRSVPRGRRERAEAGWVATVTMLLVAVLVVSTPGALSVSNGISGTGTDAPISEYVDLYGQQYYWTAEESGPIQGTFDNALVVTAGSWVQVNLTASGATQSLLVPFRDQPVLDVQAVPGTPSYAVFQAPTVPGVYGAPDGEYDGPWFGQDVSALVVVPAAGAPVGSLANFIASGGGGDIYNPPVEASAGASLVGNAEGLFNNSVPGPTLTATVPTTGGPVAFNWTVPLSSIGVDNYLVNVTSNDPNQQQQYVIDHNYTLPYEFGIYRIDPASGLVPVVEQSLRIASTIPENATVTPGIYLYGLVTPVDYSYNPAGDSGTGTGIQTGFVMGLWGVLWVSTA